MASALFEGMPPSKSSSDERGRRRSPWSWYVGSIGGIPIRIHVTLLFLFAWIALMSSLHGMGPTATLTGVLVVGIVFVIILIHELGHALMARHFGVHTRDIMLLPIGGISSLEKIPERPSQELAVALVGPAINIVIAGVIWGAIALTGGDLALEPGKSAGALIAIQLVYINLVLAGFNLLPAFPLDGGRALRAVLAMWLPRDAATQIAAGLGKALALAIGILGLMFNPWLVLIAVVVWFGGRQEVEMMRLRSALAGVPAAAAMVQRLDAVDTAEPLRAAAEKFVSHGAQVLPVVDHGHAVGVLTRADLTTAMRASGPGAPVATAPRHDLVAVTPDEPLDHVLDRLQDAPDAIAVVVDHGTPIGVVTPEQLANYAILHRAPV